MDKWSRFALIVAVVIALVSLAVVSGNFLVVIVVAMAIMLGAAVVTTRASTTRRDARSRHVSSLPPDAQIDGQARQDAMSRFARKVGGREPLPA